MTTIPLAPAPATTETRNRPPRRRLRDRLRRLDDVLYRLDGRVLARRRVGHITLRAALRTALPTMLLYGNALFLFFAFTIASR